MAFLIQSPRIAAFFELRYRVIGDRKSLLLSHPFLPAKYDLPRAPQREGNGVSKDFLLRHASASANVP